MVLQFFIEFQTQQMFLYIFFGHILVKFTVLKMRNLCEKFTLNQLKLDIKYQQSYKKTILNIFSFIYLIKNNCCYDILGSQSSQKILIDLVAANFRFYNTFKIMNFQQPDIQIDANNSEELISKQEERNIQSQFSKKKGTKNIKLDFIVRFFQKMAALRGVKKGNYCREFLKTIFKASRQSVFVYSIIRLLLPSDDRDRGNYGLKQKGIAKVISECIGLKKEDYQRLYHYKNPNYHQRGFGIGDFSLCVFDIARAFCKQRSEMTVLELNILLDQLALSNGNYNTVFRQMFQKCNAEQIKWVIRIILKDLKLSIKLESVLNAYHKDAYDYFNLTNSLIEVCKKFQNQTISLDDQISLFNPIRPMLAGKKNIEYFKHKIHHELYLETKYDGERIQTHYDGMEIKLFSRNGVNYSHVYKDVIDILMPNLQADACILDGEVVVLEKQTLQMIPFGMNKVVALSNNQGEMQLCYKVFDVMWIKIQNEQMNMMKFSLTQRKKILESLIRPVQGKLQLVDHKIVNGFDQILQEFGQSIERNQQGIMLKDPNSLYLPKQRGTSWLKLKGDYIDGLTDTLDLIIIGGFFGDKSYRQGDTNHWIDKITTFALGIIDYVSQEQWIVYPFCKVGTGYNAQDLALLRQKLKANLTIQDGKFYPRNLKYWKYSLQDKPDCWVKNIQNSILLEVKAAEIITSDSYPTNSTLRFPRVVKIRYDKDWNEGATLFQLEEMKNNKKYTKNMKKIKEDSDEDGLNQEKIQGQQASKKIKAQKVGHEKHKLKNLLLDDFKPVELGEKDALKSNLFYGLQFVVLPLIDSKLTRHDIQRQILLHGGRVSQNPLQKTNYIVADHIDFRLSIYQSEACKHISFIKPKYVMSCIREQQLLFITPLYLTCLPVSKRQYYMQSYDRFSDSYTAFVNERQLDEILSQMPNRKDFPHNDKLMQVISVKHRRQGKKSVCIGLSRLDIIKLKSQGNQIIESLNNQQSIYSIIVNGQIKQYERTRLQQYMYHYPQTIIEYVEDLRVISIL